MNNKEFEPIRIRIMQEAYELADRGDVEGYNAVKVMCNDVQNLLKREWVGLTVDEIAELVCNLEEPENRIELGQKIEAKLKERNT